MDDKPLSDITLQVVFSNKVQVHLSKVGQNPAQTVDRTITTYEYEKMKSDLQETIDACKGTVLTRSNNDSGERVVTISIPARFNDKFSALVRNLRDSEIPLPENFHGRRKKVCWPHDVRVAYG